MAENSPDKRDFDPYYTWLSIPPSTPRPVDHYTLLGLAKFETDRELIETFADKQMNYVQTFKSGPHSALTQKLLNELSLARLTLLNPEKRAAYDQQLRAQAAAVQAVKAPPVAMPVASAFPLPAVPLAAPAAIPFGEPRLPVAVESRPAIGAVEETRRHASGIPWFGIIASVVGLAVFGAVLMLVLNREPEPAVLTWKPVAGERLQSVKLDGKPVTLASNGSFKRAVPPGRREIVLARIGFRDHVESIDVEPGEEIAINPAWRPKATVVVVLSAADRAGLSFQLDDQPLAVGEISTTTDDAGLALAVEPGAHKLAGKSNRRSFVGAFEALADAEVRFAPEWAESVKPAPTAPTPMPATTPEPKPVPAVAAVAETSIDVLREINPEDVDTIAGKTIVARERIVVEPGPCSRFQLPVPVDGRDYVLTAKFTRLEGVDSVGVLLPVGDAAGTLLFNGFLNRGVRSYLSVIDYVTPGHNPAAIVGDVLTTGKKHALEVAVTRVGARRHRIAVKLDDQPFFETTVNERSLHPQLDWAPRNSNWIGFGGYNTRVAFEDVHLRLRESETPAPELVEFPNNATFDVLKSIPLDAIDRLWGESQISKERITIEPKEVARVQLPVRLDRRDYVFSTRITRLSGDECATVSLPIGDAACLLVLSGWVGRGDGGRSYLSNIDHVEAADNPNCYAGQLLPLDEPCDLKVAVSCVAAHRYQTTVRLNGEVLFSPIVDDRSLLTLTNWCPRNTRLLGVGAHHSRMAFENLRLRVSPSRPAAPDPASTPAPTPSSTEPATSLLSRRPAPSADDQQQAEQALRDAFKTEIDKADAPAERAALAANLLKLAGEEPDGASRFVARRLAVEQAALGHNYALAFSAAKAQAEEFETAPYALVAELFEQTQDDAKTSGDRKSLFNVSRQAAEEAVKQDDFDAALKLFKVADAIAVKARVGAEKRELTARLAEVVAQQKAFALVVEARKTLEQSPDDPAANSVVGRWLCEVHLDFNSGLAHLAKGDDAALKALAERDLKKPEEGAEWLALADDWWELAGDKQQSASAQRAWKIRAGRWYEEAWLSAGSAAKPRIEARLKEVNKLAPVESK